MLLLTAVAAALLLTACASQPAATAQAPASRSKTFFVTIRGADVHPSSHVEHVSVGDMIKVRVLSDRDDELHVHPTMVAERITAGTVTTVRFRIDSRATYYVEAHNSRTLLLQLAAS